MIEARDLFIQVGSFMVPEVSFFVPAGNYCVLMGKTGSGKTTLLEAICGLKKVTGGCILLNGRDVTHLKPAEREIGFVPQEGALFASFTVREHLQFALSIRRWSKKAIADRVDELAAMLQLDQL